MAALTVTNLSVAILALPKGMHISKKIIFGIRALSLLAKLADWRSCRFRLLMKKKSARSEYADENQLRGFMARNIDIKARITSVEELLPKAAAIADKGPIEIIQDDTFFRSESGRLKLRTFSKDEGELIFYRRANQ